MASMTIQSCDPAFPKGVDTVAVYLAAGLLSYCGMMGFSILPLLVSAMRAQFGFGEAQCGDAVAFFFAGVTAIAFTTVLWIRRYSWRSSALVGQAVGLLGLALLLSAKTFAAIAALLFVAGAGFGVTCSVALTVFGASKVPDRAFGANMLMQATPSTLMVIILPWLLSGAPSDWQIVIGAMMAQALACTLGIPFIPSGVAIGDTPVSGSAKSVALWKPIACTVASFLFMCSCTAPWVFMNEAIAQRQLANEWVSIALGGAQAMSIVGAIAAMWLGSRGGRSWPIVIGSVLTLVGLTLVGLSSSGAMFALGASVSFLPVNFLLAYSLALTAELDTGGRLISVSSASLLGPPLVVPPIAGRLYAASGFESNLWLGVLVTVAGAAIYLWIVFLQVRHAAAKRFEQPVGSVT